MLKPRARLDGFDGDTEYVSLDPMKGGGKIVSEVFHVTPNG